MGVGVLVIVQGKKPMTAIWVRIPKLGVGGGAAGHMGDTAVKKIWSLSPMNLQSCKMDPPAPPLALARR